MADFADIQEDAEHLLASCESLLRVLPQKGEPPVVHALRRALGGNDDFRVDAIGPSGPWIAGLQTLVDSQRQRAEVEAPALEALRRGIPPTIDLWPMATPATTVTQITDGLTRGKTAIIVGPSTSEWLLYDAMNNKKRSIDKATTEQVLIGSKVGFTEDLNDNLGLLRQWLPDVSLRVRIVTIGRRSRTRVAVAYLCDVVRPGLVPLVVEGLRRIRTDFIRTSQQVVEYLTAGSLTPFPLNEPTERPDRAATAISQGRVVLLVDKTPFAQVVPATYFELLKDDETAAPSPITTGFVRLLRQVGVVLSVSAPGLAVALLSVNPEPLQPALAASLEATRSGLPYPVFTEMLIMMLIVDIFTQATTEAPGTVGNALTIVGTLIIGQVSVQARLVSELVMIVAAATSLGTFLVQRIQFSYALRMAKYVVLFLSGTLGLFGWVAAGILIVIHLTSLKSAGVPYMEPMAPLHVRSALLQGVTRPPAALRLRRSPIWEPADATSGNLNDSLDHQEEAPR